MKQDECDVKGCSKDWVYEVDSLRSIYQQGELDDYSPHTLLLCKRHAKDLMGVTRLVITGFLEEGGVER